MVTRHYPHTQKAVSVSCDGWINISCSMGATIHLGHRRSVHLECVAVKTMRSLACEHLLHIHVTFYDYIKIAFLNLNWIYTYIKNCTLSLDRHLSKGYLQIVWVFARLFRISTTLYISAYPLRIQTTWHIDVVFIKQRLIIWLSTSMEAVKTSSLRFVTHRRVISNGDSGVSNQLYLVCLNRICNCNTLDLYTNLKIS